MADFIGNWDNVDLNDGFWDGPTDEQEAEIIEANTWDYLSPEDIPSVTFSKTLNVRLREDNKICIMFWDSGDPGTGAYSKIFNLPLDRG